jgi:hypothetical protein
MFVDIFLAYVFVDFVYSLCSIACQVPTDGLVSVYIGSVTMPLACSVLFSALITVLVGESSSSESLITSIFYLEMLAIDLLLLKLRR